MANHRLGDDIVPEGYYLRIETDMKGGRFTGSETIKAMAKKAVKRITLNASGLAVSGASVSTKEGTQHAKISYDRRGERVSLEIGKAVSGEIGIHIAFKGANNEQMHGFYRSRYMKDGKEEYMLSTQFEPADARSAFPCFDEPSFKARFDLSVVADEKFDVISNMPIKKTVKMGEGRKLVSFQTTPRMSTYLLYIGVGKFDYYEETLGRVAVRAVTANGKATQGRMAVGMAKKFIRYFERYFGIRYPLPKVDLIAVPDFAAGAMENWGAITFRETALLGDEKSLAVESMRNVAETVAHELAHQWFGNLVTMEWWEDLWLNESFATFMSYKAVDSVFPEWKIWLQFLLEDISTALNSDSLKSTHPINVKVDTPGMISSIFDAISYSKGGTILSMLEDYVGAETFREGLADYLSEHRYGNTTKHDLWRAIEAAARRKGRKINMGEVASFWIDNPGYPVIEVKQSADGIGLRQSRFLITGEREGRGKAWPVPLHYVTDRGTAGYAMFDSTSSDIKGKGAKWTKLNHGQKGLYRARYQRELLERIGEGIDGGRLQPVDIWGVESDLFAYARSGMIPLSDYLDFIERHCMGCAYPASFSIASHLQWIYIMAYHGKPKERVRKAAVDFYMPIFKKLGWSKKKGEDDITTMHRGLAIYGLGEMGDEAVVKRSVDIFRKGYRQTAKIDPNISGEVYSIAISGGGKQEMKMLHAMYKRERSPVEKRKMLSAMGSSRDRTAIMEALRFSRSKEVRLQNAYIVPMAVTANPEHREVLWGWVKSNWKGLMKSYPPGTMMLKTFVDMLSYVSDRGTREEMKRFFGKKENRRDDMEMSARHLMERTLANIMFMEANELQRKSRK